jgi:hypothetical protein
MLPLARTEEERRPGERRAAGEDDPLEPPAIPFHSQDPLLPDQDAVPRQRGLVAVRERVGAVGAEHEVAAPAQHAERIGARALIAAEHGDGLVAVLPPVAERAVMHRRAVELGDAVDLRHRVHHPGAEQERPSAVALPALEPDLEPAVHGFGAGD